MNHDLLFWANEVLKKYMPQFNDSRAVDDCLVGLAAAVAQAELAALLKDKYGDPVGSKPAVEGQS